MDVAIEATGLVKRYKDVVALDGVDLAVPKRTVLGLLGPNGAGKMTTVRVLTTLLKPDSGAARVGCRIRSSFGEAVAGYLVLIGFAYAISWVMAWVGLGGDHPGGVHPLDQPAVPPGHGSLTPGSLHAAYRSVRLLHTPCCRITSLISGVEQQHQV